MVSLGGSMLKCGGGSGGGVRVDVEVELKVELELEVKRVVPLTGEYVTLELPCPDVRLC